MRVIGGQARGTRLRTLRGTRVRPTSDLVREAIFDILGERVLGSRALDLFAGSGALGIEALSRGAKEAVFVERDQKAAEIVETNLKACHLEEKGRIEVKTVDNALAALSKKGEKFDLVFLDPPYGRGLAVASLDNLGKKGILSKQGLVVVEHERMTRLPERCGFLCLADRREYGDTAVSFFSPAISKGKRVNQSLI